MKTSIIILVKNQLEYTKQCIESIRQYTRPGTYEIIVVDNGSDDGTPAWLAEQQDLIVIRNEYNAGFPAGCNQGIARAAGQFILLLNNDTIVTRNWLDNLLNCLESDERIGAVGPVTNYCSYNQAIRVDYTSLAEMHAFAEEFNRSDAAKWEDRLKLVGYCMLIKRSVLDKIGVLDERFTPGNYEDDDLSLRIVEAGYRLVLCRDTFIHHYGSVSFKEDRSEYLNMLINNEKKFQEKWTFSPVSYLGVDYDISEQVIHRVSNQPRLLQVGSGCGGTMLWLKNIIPGAILYGVERNSCARKVASSFMYMYDHWDRLIAEGITFDAVIISHYLHEMTEPVKQLAQIKRLLKPGGSLFISARNSLHYPNIVRMIQGLPPEHEVRYHIEELQTMLTESGFEVLGIDRKIDVQDSHQSIIEILEKLGNHNGDRIYETRAYIIHAKPQESDELAKLLERLTDHPELPEVLEALMAYDMNEIIDAIVQHYSEPVGKLNWIATAHFQMGYNDRVLPFLNHAYELEPNNKDTVYNLAYVLHQWGHRELALRYLEKITDRDAELDVLYRKIFGMQDTASAKVRDLTFLIRRIEYGIDAESSAAMLRQAIAEETVQFEDVLDLIRLESSNPSKLLEYLQGSELN